MYYNLFVIFFASFLVEMVKLFIARVPNLFGNLLVRNLVTTSPFTPK